MWEHLEHNKYVYFIIVAIILFALLGSSLVFYYSNMDRINKAKVTNRSTELAKQKIEELKKERWDRLRSGKDTPKSGYARTWTVKNAKVKGAEQDDMKEIKVDVKWNQERNSVSLTTYRYRWTNR